MLKGLLAGDDPEDSSPTKLDLPLDDLLDVATSKRRRRCLRIATNRDGLKLTDLAEILAARENGTTRDELSRQQRKRVYVSLYQTHVSRLDEAGLIQWEQDDGTIQTTEKAASTVEILDELASRTAGDA